MAQKKNAHDKTPSNLDELHRELIEARNLAIKTDNLVKNLGADIKQIAKGQEAYQRRAVFNSSVAYVVFSVLIFTGLFMVFNARTSSYEREVEHFQARNGQLQTQLDATQAELQRRRESEERAYAFFELLQSGRRAEVVEQFTGIQGQLTDRTVLELLRDRVDAIIYQLADEAYREGLGYSQSEAWSEARDSYLDSLGHLELTPWAPELHINLGLALHELEDFQGSLHYLDAALASQELDEAHSATAVYYRALDLESTGRLGEAIEGFRAFRSTFPYHRSAGRALHHINRIQRVLDRSENQ